MSPRNTGVVGRTWLSSDEGERALAYLHLALTTLVTVTGLIAVLVVGEASRAWIGLSLSVVIPGAWTTVGIRLLRRRHGWGAVPALGVSLSTLLVALSPVVWFVGGDDGPIGAVVLSACGLAGMAYAYHKRFD